MIRKSPLVCFPLITEEADIKSNPIQIVVLGYKIKKNALDLNTSNSCQCSSSTMFIAENNKFLNWTKTHSDEMWMGRSSLTPFAWNSTKPETSEAQIVTIKKQYVLCETKCCPLGIPAYLFRIDSANSSRLE